MQENPDAARADSAPEPAPAGDGAVADTAPSAPTAGPGESGQAPAPVATTGIAATDGAPAPEADTGRAEAQAGTPEPITGGRAEPTLAETAAALAERFPALFTPGAPRPIKLRIQADIQQRAPGAFTRKQLSTFLHRHTTGTAYLRALSAAPQRFDLDGEPAGEVAAEHREAAVAELERRRQIVQERRAAEHAARRPPPRSAPATATAAAMAPRPAADADRPPRGARPAGPPWGDRPPRPSGPPRGDRPPRPGGPPRGDRPPPGGPPRRDDRGLRRAPDRPVSQPAAARPPREPRRDAPPPQPETATLPDDPARRERALLLRAWESSPLTPANFCALKGLKVAEFEAQIDQARRERAERRG